MSGVTLGVRGVYRRRRQLTFHGRDSTVAWSYYVQLLPFQGIYAPTVPCSRELFLKMLEAGAPDLGDR